MQEQLDALEPGYYKADLGMQLLLDEALGAVLGLANTKDKQAAIGSTPYMEHPHEATDGIREWLRRDEELEALKAAKAAAVSAATAAATLTADEAWIKAERQRAENDWKVQEDHVKQHVIGARGKRRELLLQVRMCWGCVCWTDRRGLKQAQQLSRVKQFRRL